ncbi:putative glycerol-3-phosphate transporter 1 [Iris pallida]|uniref:Glycerol-3-phosphate transporter 1 n=1 Tax=Iris pallida TaxID=29817 RepID=A0AAX6ID80_IRIPA|nr:putative glycerol-3-phosphate transporter 1 [Iris pallida]
MNPTALSPTSSVLLLEESKTSPLSRAESGPLNNFSTPAPPKRGSLPSLFSFPAPSSQSPSSSPIPAASGLTFKNRNTTNPRTATTRPGTTKDQPHPCPSNAEATKEPKMFPTEVCAFQTPMTSPLLLLPHQFPTTATTEGQPEDWNSPASDCTAK